MGEPRKPILISFLGDGTWCLVSTTNAVILCCPVGLGPACQADVGDGELVMYSLDPGCDRRRRHESLWFAWSPAHPEPAPGSVRAQQPIRSRSTAGR